MLIEEVCQESLLQARLAAYGNENDIDHMEDDEDDEEEDKASSRSSQAPGAGILGEFAFLLISHPFEDMKYNYKRW